MKLAFLYAGQGSQRPGMGKDFYEEYPQVRDIFEYKPDGANIKELCFEADMETLSRTENTQPCMGAFAAAVTRLMREAGICPDAAGGLSLGEYGALHCANVFDDRDMLELLAYRGKAMAAAAEGIEFAMLAIITPDIEIVREAVSREGDGVWCCNFNCPGQVVIGGKKDAVQKAGEICLALGARRCMPLAVGGPFHTPLMESATEAMRNKKKDLIFENPEIPVLSNVTGGFYNEESVIADCLAEQVSSAVMFEDCIRSLVESGVDTVVEVGPGKVLSGFLRKTAPTINCLTVEDVASFRATVQILKNGGAA